MCLYNTIRVVSLVSRLCRLLGRGGYTVNRCKGGRCRPVIVILVDIGELR